MTGNQSLDESKTLEENSFLNILCAGVSHNLVETAAEKWNAFNPAMTAVVKQGGSVDLIRRCIAGEPCDLLISADDAIIRDMMMPKYADGYRIWGGNKMVVAGDGITAENWEEKLLADDATFKHNNPYIDPGGYRAVMAILLANEYSPGLSERLMNHSGHIGMEKSKTNSSKEAKYEITYFTKAKSAGVNFAELPDVMNLSNPALADVYAKVNFSVDDESIVTATPIVHALTIPKGAANKEAAKKFAKIFLEIDKADAGFLPRDGIGGLDPSI